LALADPRPMSLKEKQRMTQFTLRHLVRKKTNCQNKS
jgi:hypothetical protein